jgi:hypothetical protein
MGLNYNPTIVSDGLVMYFDPANSRSSAGSGNTIYDLSGNSNTCTFSATPTYDVASKGNLLLAGYGTVAHTSTLWGSNQFTLSVWAKKTSGSRGIMIAKDINYIDHALNGTTLASFYATASYSPRQYLAYGSTSASYNEWRHYTTTYDGTVGTLYENGIQTGSTNIVVSLNNTTSPLYIGDYIANGIPFNGKLGTMMTYNRALSAQEVKQNYDATKSRYISSPNIVRDGLVLYYDMSDYRSAPFTGTSIYDLSGFGNTGTLTNGPTFSSLNDGSLVLDGSNDYVLVNNAANILSKTEYTKIAYFYVTSFSTSNNIISGGFSGQHAFWLFGSNRLYAGHNGAWSQVTGATTLSLNTWYFGAVTYSSTTGWKLYLNGVQDGSNGDTTTFTGNQEISIGSYSTGNNFTGRIGSAFVYNRVLSATEIQQNYNATKGRFGL